MPLFIPRKFLPNDEVSVGVLIVTSPREKLVGARPQWSGFQEWAICMIGWRNERPCESMTMIIIFGLSRLDGPAFLEESLGHERDRMDSVGKECKLWWMVLHNKRWVSLGWIVWLCLGYSDCSREVLFIDVFCVWCKIPCISNEWVKKYNFRERSIFNKKHQNFKC